MEIPPIFPSQINKSNPYYYLPDNYTIMTEQWWHNKFGDTLPDGYAEYLACHSRVEYDDIDREEATHKLKLNQEKFINQLNYELEQLKLNEYNIIEDVTSETTNPISNPQQPTNLPEQ
jgi:hypothetical protein